MNYREMFPSNFAAASDLANQDVVVVIASMQQEKVGKDEEVKWVLYFAGMKKGMVLNVTNGKRIAAMYGEETSLWIGKAITLYPSEVDYAGETVPCIRVRKEPPSAASQTAPVVQQVVVPAPQPVLTTSNGGPRF